MPKGKFESTGYYGVVEDIIDADPRNLYTRSFMLIDAIRSEYFDREGELAIRERRGLALVRAMSTPRRWREQFHLGEVAKGDWLSFELDDSGGIPRAWELRAENNYIADRHRSIKSMRRISGVGAQLQNGDDELSKRLTSATKIPRRKASQVSAAAALQRLGSPGRIEIVVLDVGQASAALIKRNGRPIGFFDVGAPIWFNKGSFPKIRPPLFDRRGFIILSHWDFDHFDLGRRHDPYRNFYWFAPDQPVGPNTANFQFELGRRLKFIDGSATIGGFSLSRGMSTNPNDRNGTGYQLRYEESARAVILTGDTPYDLIQTKMLDNVSALTMPHHAGRSDALPPRPDQSGPAIASYGNPNFYRHPNAETLDLHKNQGWRIETTAATSTSLRGDRTLFP
ncbi:hypothetical protein [Xanthobacter flavus]|uniref:hypothetical protein n=1 Tax=Xanthobacter flavus TaxID=281 RepID=UPI001AE6DFED|nr:hypothetical protein [Xanthobacter flavus]MBP2149518.1 hypothetical protein [Xanthobacter flavus]